MYCPLVFEFSVGIGVFVIGLGQISFFFSFGYLNMQNIPCIAYCATSKTTTF